MDDHRTSDLLYGHLGEASYDLDEKSWSFSRRPSQDRYFRLLLPPQECIPPSLLAHPNFTTTPSSIRYVQEKWLAKNVPDAVPACAIFPFIDHPGRPIRSTKTAALMAVGVAARIDSAQSKSTRVLAVAHGEAGHILHLIRPRTENLGWDNSKGATLQLLNPAASEETYWIGDGGAIQQIAFGTNNDGVTSWLAVRKPDSTTILRPVYSRYPIASAPSKLLGMRHPPSCLSPNPILSVQSNMTGARPHADVSFNPWYIKQFAILDEQGNWSIWSIEGLQRKRASAEACKWKSGHIHDDLHEDERLATPHADGWGRVLWAASPTTIIICQRHHIAIFDIEACPRRLYCPSIIDATSSDWIVEVKRNPLKLNQIFLLTTSQIFWLQITTAGEQISQGDGYVGARVLLSCYHFLDEEDESMKLELLTEGDVSVAFLYTTQNPLVKFYRFSMASEVSTSPTYATESFIIPTTGVSQHERYIKVVQTLCIVPATLKLGSMKETPGPSRSYLDQDDRFYQLFELGVNLSLSYSLCATSPPALGRPAKSLSVLAPTFKMSKVLKLSSQLVTEDQFVVPDGLDDNQYIIEGVNGGSWKSSENMYNCSRNQLSMTIDANRLFKIAFEREDKNTIRPSPPAQPHAMAGYVEQVWKAIAEKREHGIQGTSTVLELSGFSSISDDIDEASALLRVLVDSLLEEKENDPSMAVSILSLTSTIIGGEADISGNERPSHLSDVYDKMIECWVSCLPVHIPGQMRLAKERGVRDVAAEVCLASLAVTVRGKPTRFQESRKPREWFDLSLPVRPRSNFTSHESGAGQVTDTSEADNASYTAAPRTRSLTSATNYIREEPVTAETLTEDPTISRLRSYALSIRSQPLLGAAASAILDHWPSTPGINPSNYSWEATCMASAEVWDQSSDEEDSIRRKKEEQRRRRAERFIGRQRANADGATSQSTSFGSQPAPAKGNITSSQATEIALPMTQPDSGLFGSRLAQKSWKKRRTKGF